MAHLVIDNREHGLIRHLVAKSTPHRVAALPVADILCTYDAGGCSWIMERKRADDFSASIQDGRWREQTSRLMATGHRVFFVIEGDLRATPFGYLKHKQMLLNQLVDTADVDDLFTFFITPREEATVCWGTGINSYVSAVAREQDCLFVWNRDQLVCISSR